MQAGIGKLHEDRRGAEVEVLGQEVIPPFRVVQGAAVGVDAARLLVNGTTCEDL